MSCYIDVCVCVCVWGSSLEVTTAPLRLFPSTNNYIAIMTTKMICFIHFTYPCVCVCVCVCVRLQTHQLHVYYDYDGWVQSLLDLLQASPLRPLFVFFTAFEFYVADALKRQQHIYEKWKRVLIGRTRSC